MFKAEAWRQASKQTRHAGILRGCRHLREATGGRQEARETLPNRRVEERRRKRKRINLDGSYNLSRVSLVSTVPVEEW